MLVVGDIATSAPLRRAAIGGSVARLQAEQSGFYVSP